MYFHKKYIFYPRYSVDIFHEMAIMLDNLTIFEGAMDKRHIGYAVKSLSRRIDRAIENIPAAGESGKLTGVQFWVLNFLFRNAGRDIFQRDIENEFKIRRSTVTEDMQAMENAGLIRREPVEYDARLKKIVLTEYAEEVRRQIQAQVERTEERMTRGFTERELDDFFDYIARFKHNLSEMEKQG